MNSVRERASARTKHEEDRQSLIDQAHELLAKAAERAPRIVQSEGKMKIANVVAQRLQINSEEQAIAFCDAYWSLVKMCASLVRLTTVKSKRDRRGPSTVLFDQTLTVDTHRPVHHASN